MAEDWSMYQEEAADFFRSIGLDATTNAKVKGIRSNHDVDVLVTSRHAGVDFMWIVECKQWMTRVGKLHVMGLRTIVTEVGADRGILLAENGFQSGAAEVAVLTNVHLTSLSEFRVKASDDVFRMRIINLYDRIELCRERYWAIPKNVRRKYGLRQEVNEYGYSGARVISFSEDVLRKALRGIYPIESNENPDPISPHAPLIFKSIEQVAIKLEQLIGELEQKLNDCDKSEMRSLSMNNSLNT